MAGKTTGPDSQLNKELFAKIKQGVFEGKNIRELAKYCKISESTMYHWHCDNTANLADKIEGWKRDRKISLATNNLEEFLKMDTMSKRLLSDGETVLEIEDTGLVRVKADMTKFTLETLDKSNYSKRNELTGANGSDLIPTKEEKDLADNVLTTFLDDNINTTTPSK